MSNERFKLLLGLTSIRSEAKIRALHDVCVLGSKEDFAAMKHGVDKGDFNKTKQVLNHVAHQIELIKELDLGGQ